MKIAGFDWDDDNWPKCAKHGVSRQEIEQMLAADARIAPDPKHSLQESRHIAVGRNREGRPMFVAFTLRQRGGEYFIRPISARYMHAKEIERHEKSA